MSTSVTRLGIEELRARIRRLEGAAGRRRLVLPFGIKELDQISPEAVWHLARCMKWQAAAMARFPNREAGETPNASR